MKPELITDHGARFTRIASVGAYRPRRVVDNEEARACSELRSLGGAEAADPDEGAA